MISENDALYAAQQVYSKARKVKKINKGYSHEIFEVETEEYPERVIIKFANSKEERFCLRKEKRIHEMMQEKGIPVPRVIYLDDSREKVNFEFMILSKAEGVDLEEIFDKLAKKQQGEIFEEMGEILGRIHTTKFDKYGVLTPTEIKEDHQFTLKKMGKGIKINPSTLDVVPRCLFEFGVLVVDDSVDRDLILKISEYIIKNKDLAFSEEEPSLIHGDFEIRNIRIKKIKNKWKICSVLDFEYAASATREYDFIKLHRFNLFEKKNLFEGFMRGYQKYQKIPENFKEKVEYMRITRDLAFAEILFRSGDIKKGYNVLGYVKDKINKNRLINHL